MVTSSRYGCIQSLWLHHGLFRLMKNATENHYDPRGEITPRLACRDPQKGDLQRPQIPKCPACILFFICARPRSYAFGAWLGLAQIKNPHRKVRILRSLRRKRDSNPRYLAVQRFSRPPHSTTLPFLRARN